MADYFIVEGEDERAYNVETISDGVYRVTDPTGAVHTIDAFVPLEGRINFVTGNRSLDFDVRHHGESFVVQRRGLRLEVDVLNARQKRMRAAGVGGKGASGPNLESPMAGKVVAVSSEVGQTVSQGDTVIIIEAMKMENDLKAHCDGTVAAINFGVGDAVEVGDILLSIEGAE